MKKRKYTAEQLSRILSEYDRLDVPTFASACCVDAAARGVGDHKPTMEWFGICRTTESLLRRLELEGLA